MKPSIAAFNKHVELAAFQIGIDRGHWSVLDEDPERPTWPIVDIWVKAAKKENKPDGYHFRFNLEGYPAAAPTACLWDIEKDTRLDFSKWPTGSTVVTSVFRNDWEAGNALYAPCDRRADLAGHPQWKTTHPEAYWTPSSTILTYLNFLLNILT